MAHRCRFVRGWQGGTRRLAPVLGRAPPRLGPARTARGQRKAGDPGPQQVPADSAQRFGRTEQPLYPLHRVPGLISFEPDKVEVHLDGTRLRPEAGQALSQPREIAIPFLFMSKSLPHSIEVRNRPGHR